VSSSPLPDDTHVACLTPPGAGAIATLAVRGPRAWEVVRLLFRPHSRSGAALPEIPEAGRFWLGRPGDTLSDEVVLAVKRCGPVPWLEVHCHGGWQVVRLIVEALEARGVQSCTWQQLERWSADDALQALAAAALAEARTARTAAILLDQHQGAFGRELDAILAALDRDDRGEAGRLLDELAGRSAVGRHLITPWRVTVAGAPNVGKSSLVNALAGYQRSVVDATPGTTRDVVTTLLAIDGWLVEVADTAGLRDEAGDLESQGIRQARAALAAADLCLWVLDASTPPVWPPTPPESLRLVVNKVDLPAAWDLDHAAGSVHVSARTGAGLADLCAALGRWLVPEPPPPGAAVPFTASLCDHIAGAREYLAAGRLGEARRELEAARHP
jgi:tRNA modification GTPase